MDELREVVREAGPHVHKRSFINLVREELVALGEKNVEARITELLSVIRNLKH